MSSRRNTFVLLWACIALVGIAIAIKIGSALPAPGHTAPVADSAPSAPAAPADSFYDSAASSSVPGAAAPAAPAKAVPASPRAYLIGDAATGKVYLQYNSAKSLPVASMSKLVTAFVATDELSSTTLITITPAEASVAPDGSGVAAGERYTMSDLLLAMLLDSSNIAAEALASSSDRAYFLAQMGGYTQEIGMPTSNFADPSGLSPGNVASAGDMFALARYLYNYRPDILALTRTGTTTVATTTDHGAHFLASIHPFASDPRFLGGKTGRTPEAGETMMTILNIDDHPIVFIVMGSRYGEREQDTRDLIRKFEAL